MDSCFRESNIEDARVRDPAEDGIASVPTNLIAVVDGLEIILEEQSQVLTESVVEWLEELRSEVGAQPVETLVDPKVRHPQRQEGKPQKLAVIQGNRPDHHDVRECA